MDLGVHTSRRSLLLAGAAGAATFAVGCSEKGPASEVSQAGNLGLVAMFPNSEQFIVAGIPQRLPFILIDASTGPIDITEPVRFSVAVGGRVVSAPAEVAPQGEGLPRKYLAMFTTLPEPGIYDIRAEYRGTTVEASVQAFPKDEVPILQVGDSLPSVRTPTVTADDGVVRPRCSRSTECPFHQVSLDAVLTNGRPTVLYIGTPAYCQTAICGPILDLLMEVVGARTDIDVIHCEPWANPTEVQSILSAAKAPIVDALKQSYEPVMFVADGSGRIRTRLDVSMDRAEIEAALRT